MWHGLGSSGSSLWHGAEWAGHLFESALRTDSHRWERKEAGWGSGRSWVAMQAWQALPKPIGSSGLIRIVCIAQEGQVFYLYCHQLLNVGHMGRAWSWARQLPAAEAVPEGATAGGCLQHSRQRATSPSLKGDLRGVSPSLGCWGNTVKTETSLLCRFFGSFSDILRFTIITREAQGKIFTKM